MYKIPNITPTSRIIEVLIMMKLLRIDLFSKRGMILQLTLFLISLIGCCGYEKIGIYSDNDSIMEVVRDDEKDAIKVRSTAKIGISYRTFVETNITLPEGVEMFSFLLTNPRHNIGRWTKQSLLQGVDITIAYKKQQPLEGLCSVFDILLPCFNVKQCSRRSILCVEIITASR